MNRRLPFVALAALCLGAALPAAAQTTKLKWAHGYETTEAFHRMALSVTEEVKKRTNGRYEIAVFPSSSLGKESDANLGVQTGTVDITTTGAAFASRVFPRIGIAYYPYTFRDQDHLMKYATSDVFRELTEGYRAKTGIQVISVTYYGTRHSSSNKPFSTCDEMKGLKMRVPDSPAYMALPRGCGANPTPIAFAELYLALQNRTVDAQENPLPTIEAKRFYEVQKNIILTGHIIDSVITIVGPHVWNKLSEEDRKIFLEAAQRGAETATGEIKKRELVEDFKKRGLNVISVDQAAFRERILKAVDLTTMGFERRDWERIQALR